MARHVEVVRSLTIRKVSYGLAVRMASGQAQQIRRRTTRSLGDSRDYNIVPVIYLLKTSRKNEPPSPVIAKISDGYLHQRLGPSRPAAKFWPAKSTPNYAKNSLVNMTNC